jgi:two-component system, response regulator PdtaR
MGLEILVADDEALIRMGLRAMLEEMGHRVTLAADGREALRLARQRSFDLAILDIKMPMTDGLQVAQALNRAMPLPIIFLTAYSETDLVEKATDLPVHGYLVKPVQPEQLAAAIAVARKRFAEAQAAETQAAERRLVERAKGRLMAGGMSEPEAHRFLQQRARESRRSMSAVAQEILDAA